MIKQFLSKRAKITLGILNTYVRKKGSTYDDAKWWDASFYTTGVSERQTIAPDKSEATANYHYASVEKLILKDLSAHQVSISGSSVLDIGSGAGHWIDFYRSQEAGTLAGMDVSESAFDHLQEKYAGDSSVEIHHGKALDVLGRLDGHYDLVNAIGVMFHIVEDEEWAATIAAVGNILKPGGVFVIGGHFGLIDGLNVQMDKDARINKRLRSKAHWKRVLRSAGFTRIESYKNNAYLWIDDRLPENNVLVAAK